MAILQECPICHRKLSNKKKFCPCGENMEKAKRSKRVRYWINFRANGKQRRELCGYSISEARAAEGKRKSQIKEGRILDVMPGQKLTFNELSKWYLGLAKVKNLKSYWLIELVLGKFNSEFGDKLVKDIKPADLENYQQKRLAKGKAPATVNHEIEKPRAMVNKAFDNALIPGEPLRIFRTVKKIDGEGVRKRVLSFDEFKRLVAVSPRHLKPILQTGFFTGMREGEILPLTWDKIDMKDKEIHLTADDTKTSRARIIPVCDELFESLKAIPRAIHDNHVFLYHGKPVLCIRKALKAACHKAGIIYGRYVENGFVFHDLRHSFTTHCRKAGVPESTIMEITGHATRKMFERYNTIDGQDRQKAVCDMTSFLQNVDQSVDQGKKKEVTI